MARTNLSIRSKLLISILGTAISALLAGFGVIAWYDVSTFRDEMINQSQVVAQVVGSYTVTELAFLDSEEATATLGKLQFIPDLESACLYDRGGDLFAGFRCDGSEHERPPFDDFGYVIDNERLVVVQPVADEHERYGTLALSLTTRSLRLKIERYLSVVGLLVVGLIGTTSIAAGRLQALVSRPILSLVEAARRVSQQGDYTTRVHKLAEDEIGTLCDAWNEMLEQINLRQLEQTRAEAALRRSEQRFRTISEKSNDAIYVRLGEEQFVYVNPTFERMLGLPYEMVTAPGFDPVSLVAPSSREFVKALREKRLRGETHPEKYEFQVRSASGEVFDVEANTAEIVWDNEGATLGILRDITGRKRAEEQLRQQQQLLQHHARELERYARELERSNRELDQFAYVVSHDLRAPLRAIANLSTWIEEDLDQVLDKDTRAQMDLLRRRVQRMENLISGILEYSRVGRVRTTAHEVDVGELIREVVDDLSPPPGFAIRIAGGMPTILTERVRLAQVFSNLIGNAIKHHPTREGRIDIEVGDLGDHFRFSVRDNGAGIAPEYHDRIFVMFQTLQPRDRHESTGVGLAIVKKIVEDQGGTLDVESSEGEGAVFSFTWPKVAPERSGREQERV